jgi:hypothetical protein
VLAAFVVMLALSYLTIPSTGLREGFRRSLHVLGGVVFIPACITVIFLRGEDRYYSYWNTPAIAPATLVTGWVLAIGLPLLFAAFFRRTGALYNIAAAVWLVVVAQLNYHDDITQLKIYALCALAAIGLIAWGVRESQKNYINVGVIGFALTVAFFYFSSVMDKLGRSFALITGGILFLVGGYFLEKVRRKLVRQLAAPGGVA